MRTTVVAVFLLFVSIIAAAQDENQSLPKSKETNLALLAELPQPSKMWTGYPVASYPAPIEKISPAPPKVVLEAPSSHKFLDKKNLWLTAITSAAGMADAITTQHVLHQSHIESSNGQTIKVDYVEKNPIATPFVNAGWGGQMAATSLMISAQVGVQYFLHRKSHHKLERIIPFFFAGGSAIAAAHNAQYW